VCVCVCVNILYTSILSFCEVCVKGKMFHKPLKLVGEIRTTRKLELVHGD